MQRSAQLDSAIETAAREAHAPPSDFAYAAIDAMAKATNDRYTQFFTPDEFKAFNEALDPAANRRYRRHDRARRGDRMRSHHVRAAEHARRARRASRRRRRDRRRRHADQGSQRRRGERAAARQARNGRCGDRAAPRRAGRLYDHARGRPASDRRLQDAARRHRIRLGHGVRPSDARRVRYRDRAFELSSARRRSFSICATTAAATSTRRSTSARASSRTKRC